MESLRDAYDSGIEEGHIDADKALLEYINNAGVSALFNALPKWYA